MITLFYAHELLYVFVIIIQNLIRAPSNVPRLKNLGYTLGIRNYSDITRFKIHTNQCIVETEDSDRDRP